MPTTKDPKPGPVRYLSAKVAAGEFASPGASLHAPLEKHVAREAGHDRWFRSKVRDGLEAAAAKHFATDVQVKAVLQRWP